MISFKRVSDDFRNIAKYLKDVKDASDPDALDRFGSEGVAALASMTPVDTGLTASSWSYEVERNKGSAKISFYNSHINKGVPIAIILQFGHGTRNGGYVQGRDYINPAIQPVFDKLAEEAWREVTRL